MGPKRKRPRKPTQKLPPVPDYVRYTGGGRRYWRLRRPADPHARERGPGGTSGADRPGRVGRFVLRLLGQKPGPPARLDQSAASMSVERQLRR